MNSVSRQARGLTRQLATLPWKMWSRQAWLHPMQVLISSARPCLAFFMNAGSARKGRAMEIRSALPAARICSATSGVLIRLLVTNGMDTAPFSRPVTQVKAARGTMLAMVGMRASCQPMPVLMMVAPAVSTCLASATTWGQELPPATRSSMESR